MHAARGTPLVPTAFPWGRRHRHHCFAWWRITAAGCRGTGWTGRRRRHWWACWGRPKELFGMIRRGAGLADGAGRGCAVCTWSADPHFRSSSLNLVLSTELVAHLRTGCQSVTLAAEASASLYPAPEDSGCGSAHSAGCYRYSIAPPPGSAASCLAGSWLGLLLPAAPSWPWLAAAATNSSFAYYRPIGWSCHCFGIVLAGSEDSRTVANGVRLPLANLANSHLTPSWSYCWVTLASLSQYSECACPQSAEWTAPSSESYWCPTKSNGARPSSSSPSSYCPPAWDHHLAYSHCSRG